MVKWRKPKKSSQISNMHIGLSGTQKSIRSGHFFTLFFFFPFFLQKKRKDWNKSMCISIIVFRSFTVKFSHQPNSRCLVCIYETHLGTMAVVSDSLKDVALVEAFSLNSPAPPAMWPETERSGGGSSKKMIEEFQGHNEIVLGRDRWDRWFWFPTINLKKKKKKKRKCVFYSSFFPFSNVSSSSSNKGKTNCGRDSLRVTISHFRRASF